MFVGGTWNGMPNLFHETDNVSGISECTSDEELLRISDGCTGGVDAIAMTGRRSRKMTATVTMCREVEVVPLPVSFAITLMVDTNR
jgi:hypothetical protein